jgi:hypothetical protein
VRKIIAKIEELSGEEIQNYVKWFIQTTIHL